MKNHLKKTVVLIIALMLGLAAMTGCMQVNGDRVALKIDNNEYSRSEALLYFYYSQYDIEYNVYGLADSMYNGLMNYWAISTDSYSSVGMCREDAMQNMIQTKILCMKAEEYGVSLTADEETLLTKSVNRFMRNYAQIVNAAEANKEIITTFIRENMIANKVYMKITDGIDTTVDEAAMQRKRVEGLTLQIKVDADGNYLPQDQQKTIIDKYVAEIEILLNTDTTVDAIAELYSENAEMGVNAVGESAISEPEDYDPSADPDDYYDLGWGLSTGEVASLVKVNASNNYVAYFCRCVDDNDEELKQEAIAKELSNRRAELFKEVYQDILGSYKKIHVYTDVVNDFNITATLYDGSEYESMMEEVGGDSSTTDTIY